MMTARLTLARQMSERELQDAVMQAARLLGFHAYHTWRSDHSEPGFPDLVALRDERLIVVEFKRQGKHPTAAQAAWLAAFDRAGAETYLWTPMDWLSGEIERVLRGEAA